jgi:predicted transcriptional regulator of viral defense system
MTYAVETHEIAGVKVRITSPARTIVDCFRYRLKIGLDVALEALEDALSRQLVTRDALLRTAEVFRQARVMRPYLEAYSR